MRRSILCLRLCRHMLRVYCDRAYLRCNFRPRPPSAPSLISSNKAPSLKRCIVRSFRKGSYIHRDELCNVLLTYRDQIIDLPTHLSIFFSSTYPPLKGDLVPDLFEDLTNTSTSRRKAFTSPASHQATFQSSQHLSPLSKWRSQLHRKTLRH